MEKNMAIMVPDNYNIVSIIAIDPGLNNTGIAHYVVDDIDNKILSISATTLSNIHLKNHTWLDQEIHTERTIKLIKLRDAIREVILKTKPQLVIYESPFYNPFMPTAYKALIEVILTIQYTILDVDNTIPIFSVEPLLIKKIVGALNGVKGKDVVKEGVMKIEEINKLISTNIDSLDEHSIDAIAVGYTFLKLTKEKRNGNTFFSRPIS